MRSAGKQKGSCLTDMVGTQQFLLSRISTQEGELLGLLIEARDCTLDLDCAFDLVSVERWVRCLGSVNLPDSCLPNLLSNASKPNADGVGQRTCTVWRSRKCVVGPDWENNCSIPGESDAALRVAEYGWDWRGANKSDRLV